MNSMVLWESRSGGDGILLSPVLPKAAASQRSVPAGLCPHSGNPLSQGLPRLLESSPCPPQRQHSIPRSGSQQVPGAGCPHNLPLVARSDPFVRAGAAGSGCSEAGGTVGPRSAALPWGIRCGGGRSALAWARTGLESPGTAGAVRDAGTGGMQRDGMGGWDAVGWDR